MFMQKFDAIVGDVTITAKRAQQVQFTQPLLDFGLVVVVRLIKENHIRSGFAFPKPFSTGTWVLISIFSFRFFINNFIQIGCILARV